MTITLDNIIPFPLKERLQKRSSDIWANTVIWQKGDRVQVVAPSGTGKTTLIHCIWSLRHDYSGRLTYDGRDVKQVDANTMAQVRQEKMSVVFQDLRLFPKLTGWENIDLKRLMSQHVFCSKQDVLQMAEQLGVAHVMQQQAATCTYGEQQRIAIIRALVQPFEWLIMDEPFSHLDKQNTLRACQLIEDACNKRGAGFIITDLDGNAPLPASQTIHL